MKFVPPSEEELARRGLSPVRARTSEGAFQADDPATPDVNEAWTAKPAPKPVKKPKGKSKE
jgi:hypothetical protein